MAAFQPMPLFLPESEEQFTEHVAANPQVWYYYCQAAYLYIEKHGNTLDESTEQSTRLQIRITDLEEQLYSVKQDNVKLSSIIDFQKTQYNEQLQDTTRRLIEAEVAKERALAIAQPAVYTPPSTTQPEPIIKNSADPTLRKTTPLVTAPSESTRQSEKVPDPEKFNS
jgi:TolA-binding protein